jgi:hypothetical protein
MTLEHSIMKRKEGSLRADRWGERNMKRNTKTERQEELTSFRR